MLVNTRYFGSVCYWTSFQNFYPIFVKSMMNSDSNVEIKNVLQRLMKANKDVEILRQEINAIKDEIEIITEREIFKQHLNNLSDVKSESSEESDAGPPVKKTKYNFTEKDGYVIVYTDGACENNGTPKARAGLGVWFGENHPLNVSQPVRGKATNNAGEIQACISAVKIAKENEIQKLNIISDSQFTINSMTKWIINWKKNNWQLANGKGFVKNKTDFKELDLLCQSMDIKWEYVAGHKGVRGNEEADRLAKEGAKLYKLDS